MLNSAIIVIRMESHCRQITNLQMVQIIQSIGTDDEYSKYLPKEEQSYGVEHVLCHLIHFIPNGNLSSTCIQAHMNERCITTHIIKYILYALSYFSLTTSEKLCHPSNFYKKETDSWEDSSMWKYHMVDMRSSWVHSSFFHSTILPQSYCSFQFSQSSFHWPRKFTSNISLL